MFLLYNNTNDIRAYFFFEKINSLVMVKNEICLRDAITQNAFFLKNTPQKMHSNPQCLT